MDHSLLIQPCVSLIYLCDVETSKHFTCLLFTLINTIQSGQAGFIYHITFLNVLLSTYYFCLSNVCSVWPDQCPRQFNFFNLLYIIYFIILTGVARKHHSRLTRRGSQVHITGLVTVDSVDHHVQI